MKTLKKLFFGLLLLASANSIGQESKGDISYGIASMDNNYCVVLDDTKPIQSFYTSDLTIFNFTSESEAIKLLGRYSNNLISLTPDYANSKVIIHIHVDRTNELKDILWWNEYLESICKK